MAVRTDARQWIALYHVRWKFAHFLFTAMTEYDIFSSFGDFNGDVSSRCTATQHQNVLPLEQIWNSVDVAVQETAFEILNTRYIRNVRLGKMTSREKILWFKFREHLIGVPTLCSKLHSKEEKGLKFQCIFERLWGKI